MPSRCAHRVEAACHPSVRRRHWTSTHALRFIMMFIPLYRHSIRSSSLPTLARAPLQRMHPLRKKSSSPTSLRVPGPTTKVYERGALAVKNTDVTNPYLEAMRDTHDPSMHLKTIEDELKGTIGKALGKQADKIFQAVSRMQKEYHNYQELLENHQAIDHPSVQSSARKYNSIRKEAIQYRWELMVHRQAAGFIINNHSYVMKHYPISNALPLTCATEGESQETINSPNPSKSKDVNPSQQSQCRPTLGHKSGKRHYSTTITCTTQSLTQNVLVLGNRTSGLGSAQSSSQRTFSVSTTEVEKFNAMHADWWKPSKNPLISMNSVRVNYIRTKAQSLLDVPKTAPGSKNPLSNLRALDIGCGGGLLSESLARLGATTTGIDPSVDLIASARHHAETTLEPPAFARLDYVNTTAEDLAVSSEGSFDVVCLLEVIEHVKNPQSLLDSASKLLRPGGLLFLSTMNRTIKSCLLTIVGAEYISRYLPPGTHDWNLYRSPEEIRDLVEPFSLRQTDATGMVLRRPPLLSFEWTLDSKDTDINWIGCYVKE